jgi:hypothetical protein
MDRPGRNNYQQRTRQHDHPAECIFNIHQRIPERDSQYRAVHTGKQPCQNDYHLRQAQPGISDYSQPANIL